MSETLPAFRYHPNPVATGSIVPSDATCRSCERARGYIYTGPAYAEEDLDDAFCPWCIADGSAADRFDAVFVDADGIGDYGTWDSVSLDVVLWPPMCASPSSPSTAFRPASSVDWESGPSFGRMSWSILDGSRTLTATLSGIVR